MNYRKHILLVLAGVLFFLKGDATHIVGGEIYYDCLGGDRYRITLKVYRDCYNGIPWFDDPLAIGIFSSNGTFIDSLMIAAPSTRILPNTINNPCFTPPANVCVEEAVYVAEVDLPPVPGGYYLSYQRCCRNHTILNLNQPNSVGATYFNNVLDTSVVKCNNSPRFTNFPPIFICEGVPLDFDHSATDPDGDSLVYELCDPYQGADPMFPMPQPPNAPPYSTVPFLPPYNGSYPMSSVPAMKIDPQTGLLTGTPDQIGQWVVGVCVKEYRNGKLLNIHKRDFQFNVVLCPGLPVASFPKQQIFCNGNTVYFSDNSLNAFSWYWDFGDKNSTQDTSTLQSPTYTYQDTGVYVVTLIINRGTICADTATITFRIYPPLQPTFKAPPPQCIRGNSFNFTMTGNYTNKSVIKWDFGSSANPSTSNLVSPTGIVYNAWGKFPVKLVLSDYGCSDTVIDTIIVYPIPEAKFNATPLRGCIPFRVQFSDSSLTGTTLKYFWEFGDGGTSALANPYHLYTIPGVYTVRLTVITTNGCIDTVTFVQPNMITVNDVPVAGFEATPRVTSIFFPEITFFDKSKKASGCYLFFGDGDSTDICSSSHEYRQPGIYKAMQVVTNELGCTDTMYIDIEIKPEYRIYIPNAFTPNGDGKNEIFYPVNMGVKDFRFVIYDRWGNLIFETTDPNVGWDGKANGGSRAAQEDVYVYRVVFKDVVESKSHVYIGTVSLVR